MEKMNLEKQTNEGKNKEAQVGRMTRREFLRKTAKFSVLAALYPKEVLAKLSDILDYENVKNESYEEGILRLHEDVFQKNNEVQNFYFKSKQEFESGFLNQKKGREGWYAGKGTKGSANIVYTPWKSLKVLLSDPSDLEAVGVFHTHPQNTSSVFRKMADQAGKKLDKELVRPICFSSMDIFNSLKLILTFPKYAEIAKYGLIEPSGVWSYELDKKNGQLLKILGEFFETEKEIAQMSEKDKRVRREVVAEILEEKMQLKLKVEDISDGDLLDFEIQRKPIWNKLKELIDQRQWDLFLADKSEREKLIQKTITQLNEWGIKLDYRKIGR